MISRYLPLPTTPVKQSFFDSAAALNRAQANHAHLPRGTALLAASLTTVNLHLNAHRVDGLNSAAFACLASPNRFLTTQEIDGGLWLNTVTPKPSCDASMRGTFCVTQNIPGIKDNVEVCAKDATDAYAWRTIY